MVLPHQQPQNTTESRKKCKSRRSLAHPDTPPNRCTCTSDRPGPTYLPSHHPTCHPHEAYNTLPARLRHQKAVEPFDILKLFLTPSLMESMTCNTNAYAALKTSECLQEGGRKWKGVSTLELAIWFGIVVYMGVRNSPAVRDYWLHDGLNPAHPISENMSQTRFKEIGGYFHVFPPGQPKETPLGRRLCHREVDAILDQLRESSQRYRASSSHIAVDKCMT